MLMREGDEDGGPAVKFVSLQNAARGNAVDGGWRRMEISTLLQGSQSCGRQGYDTVPPQQVRLKRFQLTLLYNSSASRTTQAMLMILGVQGTSKRLFPGCENVG